MTREPIVILDHRDAGEIFDQIVTRRLGYTPGWIPADGDAGAAVAQIFSRYLNAIFGRLNQAPDKNKLAFLDLLGILLIPAQAARAPIVFTLAQGASDITAPAGTQLSAAPPQNANTPLVFETEKAVAVMSASLVRAVSLWPGRDQYVDHTADLVAPNVFTTFDPLKLANIPHVIYIAHDVLLALAGAVTLEVQFDLSQVSQTPLTINWEYWDGDIWRRFRDLRPACATKDAPIGDGTNGLTESGRYLLEAEAVTTAKVDVNGSNKFWIRGTLDQPLVPIAPAQPSSKTERCCCPADTVVQLPAGSASDRILPEVESIRLSTITSKPLGLKAEVTYGYAGVYGETLVAFRMMAFQGTLIRVTNEAGEYLTDVTVAVTDSTGATTIQTTSSFDKLGLEFTGLKGSITMALTYVGLTVNVDAIPLGARTLILVRLKITGFAPDQAFADTTELDLTKPFYPFGQQPNPGTTFYFASEEIFSKPGAEFRVFFARTSSPQDLIDVATTSALGVPPTDRRVDLTPTVAWEYWNGREWAILLMTPTQTMDATGEVDFTVPDDLEPVKVNDKEARWMRARIVSGTFGFSQKVTWSAAGVTNDFTYVVVQPPALASIVLGYSWRYGPFAPQQVFAYNNFEYKDRTSETIWPGLTFPPFERVTDTTPAVYLGFDKKLPVDSIGLFIDLVEDDDSSQRPPMAWEAWNGSEWPKLSVSDETRNLGLPGILQFIGPDNAKSSQLFGETRYWVRGRLKEDEPPPAVPINRIYTNSVWAVERRTLVNVPLGASNGAADQSFIITQTPVLDGEQIEVRELAGPRANVEWRILARELDEGGTRLVNDLERQLAIEGPITDVQSGPLHLRRDRNRQITEAWVLWNSRPYLYLSGPNDRDYAIDRARGVLLFGDGVNAKIPAAGALIRAAQFRAGGGSSGNVKAGGIAQLLGPLAGVQSVANPKPAEGGADRETMEQYRVRAPRSLRHQGRAITAADYETLAREASPAVAFARAVPNRNDGGRTIPGWVSLIIIPESSDPRPYPSFGLREHVQEFLMSRMPTDVAAISRIVVTGPKYFAVDVSATVAPIDPSEAGIVEQRVRTAIESFLHPLHGGPEGRGWELGRSVYISDLAVVIEQVDGVNYTEELALLTDGVPRGESVPVPAGRMVVSGRIELSMKAPERQKALQLSASGESL